MIVGYRLKYLRELKNVSQDVVAAAIGVSRTVYGRYESEVYQASYDIIRKLAKYHNVSIDFIYGITNVLSYETEQQHSLIGVADFKELCKKLAKLEVDETIPISRIPYLLDSFEKDILGIKIQLFREKKLSFKRKIRRKNKENQ